MGGPGAPHLDGHGQQLPFGPHLEQDERGGHVLLLSSDHVGRNSVQQAEVSLKQGPILQGGGAHPGLGLKAHPLGARAEGPALTWLLASSCVGTRAHSPRVQ